MIRGFRHKGLEAYCRRGSKRGINPEHADRLRIVLTVLDAAVALRDYH